MISVRSGWTISISSIRTPHSYRLPCWVSSAKTMPGLISSGWSSDQMREIRPGMVFALETQHGKRYEWGVRIEEMLIVHPDRTEIISTFPVEEITVVA